MSNYKKLRDVLRMHRKHFYDMLNENDEKISTYNKLKSTLEAIDYSDVFNVDYMKLIRLKRYFPDQKEEMETLLKLENYKNIIDEGNARNFNFEEYDKLITYSSKKFGVPPRDVLQDIRNSMEEAKRILAGEFRIKDERVALNDKPHSLKAYTHAICQLFADTLRQYLLKVLDEENQIDLYQTSIDSYKEKLSTIEKYYHMFSDTELLIKFETKEELEEFMSYIKKILNKKDYLEVIKDLKEDQAREEVIIDNVTFDSLDLSFFNEEEINVIEELREIIEDEDINDNKDPFSDVEISLEARKAYYKEANINDILLDTRYLLNNIYDYKSEVIKIFKLIIEKYKKYSLNVIRNEKIIELLKIKNDFNNIISFINKSFRNRDLAYKNEKEIKGYIDNIDIDLIPIIRDMVHEDLDYDIYYDNEVDEAIIKYNKIVKKWKKEMSLSYKEDELQEEKEDTNNLVFCIADVDLSTSGFDKEFIGTVEALETKSFYELKGKYGRTSMSKIRKDTETGKEKSYVDYLETRKKRKIHFVPYRYSSNPNYRTGLIKFEPSTKVKEFLEEHYGLSKQSAYFGIFQIITAIGADHTEYYYLQNYILNNFDYIDELANLFASDNPDFNKLVNILDELLLKKKNLLKSVQNTMN